MLALSSLLIFATVYAAAVATPGPGVVAFVARALAGGFWSAIPMIFGMLAGDLVLMTLSAFGLALAAQAMGDLFLLVKVAGGLYLIYLGWKYWTAPVELVEQEPASAASGFLSMFTLTLGNPKAIAFFVALLPTLVDIGKLNPLGFAQLAAVSVIVLPAVCLAYAALASSVRRFFASVTARRRMNKGAGAIMIGAGVSVAVT